MLRPITSLIEELTQLWTDWMSYHHKANDEKLSYADRRKAGMKCEELQRSRYKLLEQMDSEFDKLIDQ